MLYLILVLIAVVVIALAAIMVYRRNSTSIESGIESAKKLEKAALDAVNKDK
jgi:uncharacterized protein (UPF0333 family)